MTRKEWDNHMRLIGADRGRIFSVTFKRRTHGKNGEKPGDLRRMVCRIHVTKGVKGERSNAQSDFNCNCVTVFEFAGEDSKFKRIPLDGIVEITSAPSPDGSSPDGSDESTSRQGHIPTGAYGERTHHPKDPKRPADHRRRYRRQAQGQGKGEAF